MTNRKLKSIAGCAGLAAIVALALYVAPVRAAQPAPAAAPAKTTAPVFPIGSHIGLVPPPGMIASKTFTGFVDPDKHAAIIVGTLPAGAYPDLKKTLTPAALKKQGITLEKTEPFKLGFGTGTLLVGTLTASDKTVYRKWMLLAPTASFIAVVNVQVPENVSAYSDSVVRTALATLAVRAVVPQAEFLQLLPFKITDLAGFRLGNIIPGRAVLLIDAPPYPHMVVTSGLPAYEFDARAVIAAIPGGPGGQETRAQFARFAFGTISGIKNIQFTMSEPVRISDQEGFETVAHAQDAGTGANLMVVQWLRFGTGASLQMVGIARAGAWARELPRLRAIRDSIRFK
jgi:hypothetical protein